MIDNEFMNKKKSNKCCIYHKPRRWDESDTDETSSDEEHDRNDNDHDSKNEKDNKSKNRNSNISTSTSTESQTVTMTITKTEEEGKSEHEMHVTWDESVIDNEFMNKKKSNKCCIYHKPRRWDESDSDETSSSEEYHNDPNYKKPNIDDINNAEKMSIDREPENMQTTQDTATSSPKLTPNQAKSEKNERI